MNKKNWKKIGLLSLLALSMAFTAACDSQTAKKEETTVVKTQAELDAEKKVEEANQELISKQEELKKQEAELKVQQEAEAKAQAEADAAKAEADKQAAEAAAKEAEAKAAAEEAAKLEAEAKATKDAAEKKALVEKAAKAKAEAEAAAKAAKVAAAEKAKAEAEAKAAAEAAKVAAAKAAKELAERKAAEEAAAKAEMLRKEEEARLAEERRIAEEARKLEAERKAKLTGTVKIDGSSTVFPISEAVATNFNKEVPNVRVPVAVSGTGGGFKKFCAGETDINDASRTIKSGEADTCKSKGIEYLAFEVAYDGITVVVNQNNDFAKNITQAELKMIFEPNSKAKLWSDVRKEWPAETIKIYSPGTASGTFDYFTEHINGKAGASRNDSQVTFSENDNVLVQGVSGSKYAIGYFGYSYYEENMSKLNALSVDNVAISYSAIQNASYPISRMLYIYVNKAAFARPEVKEYVTYYMQNVGNLVKGVGYIKLPQSFYDADLKKIPQ